MIYTSYDMVRDCSANQPEGWRYFIVNYVPFIRRLLEHYGEGKAVEPVLTAVARPDAILFQSLEPLAERQFLAELRQQVVAAIATPAPEIEIELATVAEAFEPLTVVEKQAAWLESMGYAPPATGPMMRMSPETVAKIRVRAAELLRAKSDRWSQSALAKSGPALGRAAAAGVTPDCLSAKDFLDIIDGRATWASRQSMERHVTACWRCIDHFCRLLEVVALGRGLSPLEPGSAAPFFTLLGLPPEKRSMWKRLSGG